MPPEGQKGKFARNGMGDLRENSLGKGQKGKFMFQGKNQALDRGGGREKIRALKTTGREGFPRAKHVQQGTSWGKAVKKKVRCKKGRQGLGQNKSVSGPGRGGAKITPFQALKERKPKLRGKKGGKQGEGIKATSYPLPA